MEIWEAIVLGAIQGLTEFLPVSSSGHLELANYLLGIHEPNNLGFAMAVHGATVLSTLVVFRKEIIKIIQGVFKFKLNDESVFAINILISLIPIIFIGLMFKETIEGLFTSNLIVVGAMLMLTSALLTFAHYAKPGYNPITPKNAFIIGLAQACAVIPGLSRSGSTISTGLMMGVDRKEVAKFSFLMVLIPIIGMNILEIINMEPSQEGVGGVAMLAGALTAFITGTIACKLMIKIVSKGKLLWFAAYCLAVGIISIAIYV